MKENYSHFTGWQLQKIVCYSEIHSFENIICVQPKYSLPERNIERELFSVCRNEGLGVIAQMVDITSTSHNNIQGTVIEIAQSKNLKGKQIELSWILHKTGVHSVTISPSNSEQLQEYLVRPPTSLVQIF